MNEEKEEMEKEKLDNEEAIKKYKEKIRKQKEERRKNRTLKKYSEMINYPNMNVEIQEATERDSELFNNLFNEEQVICQNNTKRYIYCSTIFIIYAAIGFMYYTYIY
jgi:hypothetical protein